MANGVQLATAYISLNVRTDNIKNQVSSALNGTSGLGHSHGVKIGKSLSSGIYSGLGSIAFSGSIFAKLEAGAKATALKIGTMMATAIRGALAATGVGLGIAGLGGIAGVLTAGLDRMKTKQAATVQLSLTLSPAEIKKVTNDVQKVVDGIPVSMDQAMASIPKAIQAGIDPSQWVTDIANAAASSGGQASYEDVSLVMGQVIGKGKLLSEEMQQLAERGVDVRWALKQAFGWDDKTLMKNIEKGKVGIDQVRQAIQMTWGKGGGLAKKMNETISGATGSLKAQIAKLGENFLGAIFGDPNDPNADPAANAAKGIVKVTDGIRDMVSWVSAHKGDIHNFFTKAGDAANALWTGVKKVWEWLGKAKDIAVDVGGKIGEGFTNAKASVEGMWNKVSDVYGKIKTKLSDIVDDIKKKFDGIFGPAGWFAQQFDKLGRMVDKVREVLGLGEATANAAGPGDTTPLNRGPVAPGQTPPIPPGARVVPGTIGPGSGGTLGVPQAAIAGSGYTSDSALLSRVPAGRYVNPDEMATGGPKVADLTQGLGDCSSAIQDLVAIIEGQPTGGRSLSNGQSMYTGTMDQWAQEHGFIPTNVPMPGTFQVGLNDHHTQATLPGGTPFNWGSDAAAAQGGQDGGLGAWDPSFNQHYYKRYSDGGKVWGAGTATSDSIPAMLSNGEHVLTAEEVKKMGGQQAVYGFRNQLRNGGVPRFDTGGAVDPALIDQYNNDTISKQKEYEINTQKWQEVQQNADATEMQRESARQAMESSGRAYQDAMTDNPIRANGGTPPDRSLQNNIYSTTDAYKMAMLNDAAVQENPDAPQSQKMESAWNLEQSRKARYDAINAAQKGDKSGESPKSFLDNLLQNTQGYIPTGGGGKAGTSSLAQMIGMGSDVVNGLIDTGASLANMAVSGALAAGSFGAAAAAGPAAGMGINMAASELKTMSKFWLGSVPGIAADALIAQMFPIGGPPRLLGYDYTQFAPQLGILQAANTTLQQMGSSGIQKYFADSKKGAGPNIPQLPGAAAVTPVQAPGDPGKTAYAAGQSAPVAAPQAPPSGDAAINGTINGNPLLNPLDPNYGGGAGGGNGGGGSWATGGHVGIYDQGGVLNPGDIAVNKSKTPEKVLTPQQWEAMSKLAVKGNDGPMVQIGSISGFSPEDVANQIQQKQRLAAMQHSGRPYK